MIALRACIDVDDLDKAIAFYRDALGLRPGRRLSAEWVEMLGAQSPIDLLANPAGTPCCPSANAPQRSYRRHWTPVHLDFVVEDVEASVAKVIAAGGRLDREIQDRIYGRMANVADPFGNGLCLLEMHGRGYDAMVEAGSDKV
jgi:predicted enzyme related to lactoylglutathione lyase